MAKRPSSSEPTSPLSLSALKPRPNRRTGQVKGSISKIGRLIVPAAFQHIHGLLEKKFYMLYFDPLIELPQFREPRQILAMTFHDKEGEGYYRFQRVKETGLIEIRALLRDEGFEVHNPGKVDLVWDEKQQAVFIDVTSHVRWSEDALRAAASAGDIRAKMQLANRNARPKMKNSGGRKSR